MGGGRLVLGYSTTGDTTGEDTLQINIEVPANEHNKCYLECKKLKMGHLLHMG